MNKILVSTLIVVLSAGCSPVHLRNSEEVIGIAPEVEEIFKSTMVIDGVLEPWGNDANTSGTKSDGKEEIAKITALTGVHVFSKTVDMGESLTSKDGFNVISDSLRIIGNNSNVVLIKTYNDIDRAYREKKLGIILYSQVHWDLNGSVQPIEKWFGQGLRIFQIAYGAYIRNEDDPGYRKDHERMLPEDKLGEGGREEMDVPGGVTDLGKQAIKKMNQLHMLIDCSHCGNRTTLETTQLSKTPVIANHSASSEVVKGGFWPIGHWRNKTDEALRAIAEKGGVIGVTPIRWMLSTQN